MSPTTDLLPVELVFNPNWWHKTAGISFDRSFYFDPQKRIENDMLMRRVLHERYGDLGMGVLDPEPRPVIGSVHVAGGFVIPALLGCDILFEDDAAPQPLPLDLAPEQVESLKKPDFRMDHGTPDENLRAMYEVVENHRHRRRIDMDQLEKR